jgi:putative transposase
MAHRKTIKHYHEPGHLHELTFSCYQRKPLLTNDDWRTKLARSLDDANSAEKFQLIAFVFMPEHVHLLVFPTTPQPNFGTYLARIKQPFSKQIKAILVERRSQLVSQLTVQERPGKTCFRFWQEGPGFDRNLFTPEAIPGFIGYVHHNPVKRGLCKREVDWKWSSARYYLLDPPRQQFPGLPYIHGPPPGLFD